MYKYVGNGEFYPGIPSRDLSDDEGKAYGVQGLSLYRYVKEKKGPEGGSSSEENE